VEEKRRGEKAASRRTCLDSKTTERLDKSASAPEEKISTQKKKRTLRLRRTLLRDKGETEERNQSRARIPKNRSD